MDDSIRMLVAMRPEASTTSLAEERIRLTLRKGQRSLHSDAQYCHKRTGYCNCYDHVQV